MPARAVIPDLLAWTIIRAIQTKTTARAARGNVFPIFLRMEVIVRRACSALREFAIAASAFPDMVIAVQDMRRIMRPTARGSTAVMKGVCLMVFAAMAVGILLPTGMVVHLAMTVVLPNSSLALMDILVIPAK